VIIVANCYKETALGQCLGDLRAADLKSSAETCGSELARDGVGKSTTYVD